MSFRHYSVRRVGSIDDQKIADALNRWSKEGWRAQWFWPQEGGVMGNVIDMLVVCYRDEDENGHKAKANVEPWEEAAHIQSWSKHL